MPQLTRNLFYGSDQQSFSLEIQGQWPDDIDGCVFNVGPARTQPGGHWFTGQGMLCRVDCRPGSDGRLRVDFGRIETPLDRIRQRVPELFRSNGVSEVSPFGFSNFANTNVQFLGDRLFLGYDVGRPIEADPETLEYVTPVGTNAEWLHTLPGAVEPMTAVAAHPGPAWDENALYFANYELIPLSPERGMRVCRWDLEGAVEHWKLEGVAQFDTIHDLKITRDYVVISDLPFVNDPVVDPTLPRRAVAGVTNLWIIRKADLRSRPSGSAVPYRHLTLPLMTGHLAIDYENEGSRVTAYLAHHPLTDLGMGIERTDVVHGSGEPYHPDYEGLFPLALQPSGIGRYVIDAESGQLLDGKVSVDTERFWGGTLFTHNIYASDSQNHVQNLWYTSTGFEPELVSERWWQIYSEQHENVFVAPRDFPRHVIPGALARFETRSMEWSDLYAYDTGTFPHPPTFVPRVGASHDADGYVLVSVHRDGNKAIDLFDAQQIAAGPIATATGEGYNHPLLLHSTWSPRRQGPRPSSYLVEPSNDAWATLLAFAEQPGAGPSIGRTLFDLAR